MWCISWALLACRNIFILRFMERKLHLDTEGKARGRTNSICFKGQQKKQCILKKKDRNKDVGWWHTDTRWWCGAPLLKPNHCLIYNGSHYVKLHNSLRSKDLKHKRCNVWKDITKYYFTTEMCAYLYFFTVILIG